MAARVLLLTGFEPFGDDGRNPSLEIARSLSGRVIDGCRIVGVELPVDTLALPERMAELLAEWGQELAGVVQVGLANGRAAIGLERVAINCRDFPIPDNAGNQPMGLPCVAGGPAAYFSTLPLRQALVDLRKAGVPAFISNTAGTYLCNQAMYTTLHLLGKRELAVPAGFVHVPYLPEQVAARGEGLPSLAFEVALRAAEIILLAVATATPGAPGPEIVAGAVS